MAGSVLQIEKLIDAESLGTKIADMFHKWDTARKPKKEEWKELYKYIYATDTQTTSNSTLPWKNTTTTPKLTQIRDNLYANYMASMFPKRRWLIWEGSGKADETKAKTDAIKAYMGYVIDYPEFKNTVSRLVLDYIDNGNCFAAIDWVDERIETDGQIKTGYVGPVIRRVSPYDIVMNPTATEFGKSPKIVRTLLSLGEVEEHLQRLSTNEGERAAAEATLSYMKEIRNRASSHNGTINAKETFYQVDGFGSYQEYLESGYAEVLTFYGDLYDSHAGTLYKNQIIEVVDRHKVVRNEVNPAETGLPPIFHVGWRPRQDNLWAMGPLDNLVGMQYRVDHLENLKADFFDLITFPPLKVKGYVEDFEWGPFEKIFVGDEGDVEVLGSNHNPLQANLEIEVLQDKMEELAGSPKEAMGFRTPGEKTKYEVQRLENAAGRIFQAKITQFEEMMLEMCLNGMLELGRRKMDPVTVRVLDDEFHIASFKDLTADDIAGAGRIRPIAARHFAESAERVQNISNFFGSAIGADERVKQHFSSVKLAEMMEELLDIEQFEIVQPYIGLTEQAEGQRIAMQNEEDTLVGAQTAGGIAEEDFDEELL